jgi:tetratricopeptide (TPR) repeat protein
LISQCEVHRLSYFDFDEVSVARRLAELRQAGLSPQQVGRVLAQLQRDWPLCERPLLELPIVIEGRRLLVRRDDETLVEPRGQLRIDFAALDEDSAPATVSLVSFVATRPAAPVNEATPEQLVQWAEELAESGDLKGAAEMFRAALAAGGPKPEWCFQLAELLYRLGETLAARERYYMAIELDDDFVEARANLGCLLAETGETELALAAFAGALRYHPDYADVHYSLARTLEDANRSDEAKPHWQRFLELSPDSPWAEEVAEKLGL